MINLSRHILCKSVFSNRFKQPKATRALLPDHPYGMVGHCGSLSPSLRAQTHFWLSLVSTGDKQQPEIRLLLQATCPPPPAFLNPTAIF